MQIPLSNSVTQALSAVMPVAFTRTYPTAAPITYYAVRQPENSERAAEGEYRNFARSDKSRYSASGEQLDWSAPRGTYLNILVSRPGPPRPLVPGSFLFPSPR
jgi:hypothetical protein